MSDDLDKLVKDLQIEAELTPRELRGVVGKGAFNVKRDWRKNARGIRHAPRYPLSINYDLDRTDDGYEAVIGPEANAANQGFLGAILEFGGAHNAPGNHGGLALEAEAPRLEQAVHEIAGKHLR